VSEYLEKLKSLTFGVKKGDTRGKTVQLPKNYKYAKRHDKDGNVCWTTRQEAREISARAQDAGEHVHFDA
jgi:hypothetical protein